MEKNKIKKILLILLCVPLMFSCFDNKLGKETDELIDLITNTYKAEWNIKKVEVGKLSEIDKISIGFGLEEKRVGRRINEQFCCYAKDTGYKKTAIERENPPFYDHQYIHARTSYALSGFKNHQCHFRKDRK